MRENTVRIGDIHVDLAEVSKLESIEKLKEQDIFTENADQSNQAAWDAAQEYKAKEKPAVKVDVVKAPKNKP